MRRYFISLLLLALSVSCGRLINDDMLIFNSGSSSPNGYRMIIDDVIALRNNIATKSTMKFEDYVVEPVIYANPSTKSTISSDTIAYVINFNDNNGFAVVKSNQNYCDPIVAITESGSLDVNLLHSFLYSDNPEDENEYSDIDNYIYHAIANDIRVTPRITVDTVSVTYGEWMTKRKIGPLVTTKWNQTYPFNKYMPSSSLWENKSFSYYRGLPPVGCVNVALGQLLASNQQPFVASGVNGTYQWNDILDISNYSNLSEFLPGQSSYAFESDTVALSKVNKLADFLNYLSIITQSTVSGNGTGSNIQNACNAMQILDSSYYSNAHIVSYSEDSDSFLDCIIDDNKPVYFRGTSASSNTGHAWLVDGYLSRERYMYITILVGLGPGTSTSRRIQQSYLCHINWGYSGKYDGYYNIGVFNMSERQDIDSIIDTNPNTSNGTSNYSVSIQYIAY